MFQTPSPYPILLLLLPLASLPYFSRLHPHSSFPSLLHLQAEVTFLGKMQHPNLVRLLGHSHGYTQENSLVYEYVPLRSLDTHLFSKGEARSDCSQIRSYISEAGRQKGEHKCAGPEPWGSAAPPPVMQTPPYTAA